VVGCPGEEMPRAPRPELKYVWKGRPGAAPMWQWTRQHPQATNPASLSGQAARVRQQNG
jgi:hypothetical protein